MGSAKKIVSKLVLAKITEHDHRLIGAKQNLFFFNDLSHGSCFFLPHGAYIYNKLIEYLREEYKRRNYVEIITPNIYDCRLWELSGHWKHYRNNVIKFGLGEKEYSLKPMNCPGHCLMFKHIESTITSDKLPIRWADFGVLHRNELSGTLMGLSRVRRFQQDDAHIFCTPEQVENEVKGCLDFASKIYGDFDFSFDLALSSRPVDFMGDPELWNKAENSLRIALDNSKLAWNEQKFEGAFYGPKIDLVVKDSQGRSQQCATIQLDFQLPHRFDLNYKDLSDKKSLKKPVMIHRAILGSIERFMAMVAENCAGKWPFWLSPIQALIIPVSANQNDYAMNILERLKNEGIMAECELNSNLTLNRKIRDGHESKYNFILIVGDKESASNAVTARVNVDSDTHQRFTSLDKIVNLFKEFKDKKVKCANKEFLTACS